MKKKILERDGFEIYFEALDDFLQKGDLDDSTYQETCDSIENGSLVLFCAKVTVEKAGIEIISDYLGSCIYESEEQFYTEENGYFQDMVNTVLKEAPQALQDLIEKLKK